MKRISLILGFLCLDRSSRVLLCDALLSNFVAQHSSRSISSRMVSSFVEEDAIGDSQRLQKARMRLAEAQGIIPIGASENPLTVSLSDYKTVPSQSKVREISWRVAEPAVRYDPVALSTRFFAQPFKWVQRNAQFLIPMTFFTVRVLLDIISQNEIENRAQRAEEILNIISAQSPALIKAGQALASRPDLLPKEYLDSLQKLQDRCPAYPTAQAISLFEEELRLVFDDVFELDTETSQPIAAASIGQVYKGRLKSNGAKVAIKIQRPYCEESIAVDMFIMRWYASLTQKVLKAIGRNIDLVSVIDDFGDLIYREIDYRAEAVNAQRFAELYASIPDVFVPKMYTDLSTSKVLIMEWVDGARLNDKAAIEAYGLDSSKFVDVLVQCSLRQMLENGFFHADPHAGNLLAMPSGKLCYLDFGMVSYVESSQRYSIIEAVVHLVNRDFTSLAELYRRMGFIPMDVDAAPIVLALEAALPDVLNSAVGELNFKTVIAKLGDVMYQFPFSLPPFYIAIIRCLGVLEGLAIQVDDEFKIISDAYPYIASRLLTDPSVELQAALEQLLFKDGQPRWERLQSLLEEASSTTDYDVTLAVDQLVVYMVSDKGKNVRDILSIQLVEILDTLGSDSLDFVVSFAAATARKQRSGMLGPVVGQITGVLRQGQKEDQGFNLNAFSDALMKAAAPAAQAANPSPALVEAFKTLNILRGSDGFDTNKLTLIARNVLREPVAQSVLSKVFSELSERAAARFVRRVFNSPIGVAPSSAISTSSPAVSSISIPTAP